MAFQFANIQLTRKIVLIGPESTGKTSLCEKLAVHFNTSWCPEFARQFLVLCGNKYGYHDLLNIAKGQIEQEDRLFEAVNGKKDFFFIDTDMYVMKVWSEFVFGKCDRFILDQIVNRHYDLYLLCNTDVPWEEDELRECPDLETREKLFKTYKDLLVNQSVPWVEMKGIGPDRLALAIRAVESIR